MLDNLVDKLQGKQNKILVINEIIEHILREEAKEYYVAGNVDTPTHIVSNINTPTHIAGVPFIVEEGNTNEACIMTEIVYLKIKSISQSRNETFWEIVNGI